MWWCVDPWSIWRTGHLQAERGRLVTPVSRLPTLPAVQGNTEHSLPDQRDQRQPWEKLFTSRPGNAATRLDQRYERCHHSAQTETNGNGDGRDSITFPLSGFSMLFNVMVVGWVGGLPVTTWKIPHFRWIRFYWRDVTLSIITRPTDSLSKFDETKIKGID